MTTNTSLPAPSLSEHLIRVAGLHALRVLRYVPDEASELDTLTMAYDAGACVELLSKAVLAGAHPILLRPVADWRERVPVDLSGWSRKKTLDAAHVLQGASTMLGIAVRPAVAAIQHARNDAIHLGAAPDEPERVVADLALWLSDVENAGVQIGEAISAELATSLWPFRALVAQKIADARASVRVAEPNAQRDAKERALAEQSCHAAARCPACAHIAGWDVDVDIEVEYEGPGEYSHYEVYTSLLTCPFCKLELDDREEQALLKPLEFLDDAVAHPWEELDEGGYPPPQFDVNEPA